MKKKENKNILNAIKIPFNIRWISISLFLFMIGWGLGGDTFFSVYVTSILGAGLGVTLVGALLAFVKLLVVIPVGVMNDQGNTRYLLLLGKITYAFAGCLYFMAGVEKSVTALILAVVINGIASSMMFTTYRTLYGKKGQVKNRSKIYGVYFSSINMSYVIGALASAALVSYIELPYMYLFIVIFSMLSLLQDHKIQDFLKRNFSKSRKKLENKKNKVEYEFDEDIYELKKMMGKRGVLHRFTKEITSTKPRKSMFVMLKKYGWPMYVALGAQALVSFMNYVGFLFIPIVAIENHLSLSQIAILFAVMKLPYIINIFVGSIGDRYSKKLTIILLVLINSCLYILLGLSSGFTAIIVLSFLTSLGVALLSPVVAALINGYTKPKDMGMFAGLSEFVSRIGEMVGSIGFGVLATQLGMNTAFILLGVALAVISIYLLIKKLLHFKTRDNEGIKLKQAQRC